MTNAKLIQKMVREAQKTYPDWDNYSRLEQKEKILYKVGKYLEKLKKE